jgi:group I intron endonuclease
MSTLKQPVNSKSQHKHVVYKHTAPNGKAYIGLTNNYKRRCKEHVTYSNCSLFYRAINKYGWDSFTHEFLATGLSIQAANHFEEFYIRTHNTLAPNGYNAHTGGDSHSVCEETRVKIGAASSGRILSDEHKSKIGAAGIGKKHSPEAIAKMVEARNNRHPVTEEIRIKMSAAHLGVPLSESHSRSIGFANRKSKFKLEYTHYCKNVTVMSKDTVFTVRGLNLALNKACHASTIRTRIKAGEFPNTYYDNVTKIPLTDVIDYYEKYKLIYLTPEELSEYEKD